MTEDLNRAIASEAARMEQEADQPRTYSRVPPPNEPSQVYSVRIPLQKLEELRRVASDRGQAPSALLREWVLDRLARETAGAPDGPIVEFPGDASSAVATLRKQIISRQLAV